MENQPETTENIYKLWQDTETLDGDAENQGTVSMQKLINTASIAIHSDNANRDLIGSSYDESDFEYDSEDEDLTMENRELRREILRNFIANTRVTKHKTGKFTNM